MWKVLTSSGPIAIYPGVKLRKRGNFLNKGAWLHNFTTSVTKLQVVIPIPKRRHSKSIVHLLHFIKPDWKTDTSIAPRCVFIIIVTVLRVRFICGNHMAFSGFIKARERPWRGVWSKKIGGQRENWRTKTGRRGEIPRKEKTKEHEQGTTQRETKLENTWGLDTDWKNMKERKAERSRAKTRKIKENTNRKKQSQIKEQSEGKHFFFLLTRYLHIFFKR